MPEPAPVGIVDPRLAAERHAYLENRLVAIGDPGRLVALQPDAVPGAMLEELLKAGLADLVEALLVDLFGDGPFFHVCGTGIVCSQHRLVQLPGMIAGRSNRERAFTLHVVAADG